MILINKITKPKYRSKLRSMSGIIFYSLGKYLYWLFNLHKFSKSKLKHDLEFVLFTHRTPLYRQLQGVESIYQYNKVTNLKIAVPKLNNIIINPGERFSYWKIIGSINKSKGYKEGIELFYGKFRPSIGGGLCQLSNLLYWMFLHTPLTVSERHRHSYDVFPDANRKLPFGSGATCYYPFMDLEIINNTNDVFQIKLSVSEDELIGEIRCDREVETHYKVYEKSHRFSSASWGGHIRHNAIWRDTLDKDGKLLQSECVTENNALCMYNPYLEG